MAAPVRGSTGEDSRAFIDLHCHTSASFDSLATLRAVLRAAAARGLTHLAVTDHDRIDAALRARDVAPPGLTVIVGEEVKTADGDLIAVFLREVVPPGLSAVETIAAVREQGGLVGVPHPFDRLRGFGRKSGAAARVDRRGRGLDRDLQRRVCSADPPTSGPRASPWSTACRAWPPRTRTR